VESPAGGKDLKKRKNRADGETLTADHIERVLRRFELHVFPWIGSKSIGDVTEDDVLSCLIRLEDADRIDTARRRPSTGVYAEIPISQNGRILAVCGILAGMGEGA
jgi:hypothetical protein